MRALPVLLVPLLLVSCHPRPDKHQHRDASMAMYTVQWGDTLEWIAWDFGVPGGYPELARLNSIRDPDFIYMGQHLRIPRTGYGTEALPPWPAMDRVQSPPKACSAERLPAPQPAQVPGCARRLAHLCFSLPLAALTLGGHTGRYFLFSNPTFLAASIWDVTVVGICAQRMGSTQGRHSHETWACCMRTRCGIWPPGTTQRYV